MICLIYFIFSSNFNPIFCRTEDRCTVYMTSPLPIVDGRSRFKKGRARVPEPLSLKLFVIIRS